MLKALVKSLRPHQWVKNLFVVVPLLFAKQMLVVDSALTSLLAFFLFGMLSGSVYVVNDIFDIEKDRVHPTKRNRPIASGALPLPVARLTAALLIILALGGAWLLDLMFFVDASSYLLLNLAYSLALKHIPFLDVLSIASGFLLRVLAGAHALHVAPSPWLLANTFVLACLLGFGKRAHELASSGLRASEQRAVLSRYRLSVLRPILWITAVAATALYIMYTQAEHTVRFFGTNKLLCTTPFAVYGIIRFLLITSAKDTAESPTDRMLRDLPFILNLCLWGVVTFWVIYH